MNVMLTSGWVAVDFGMFLALRAHWLGERGRQEKKMETQSRNDIATCDRVSKKEHRIVQIRILVVIMLASD